MPAATPASPEPATSALELEAIRSLVSVRVAGETDVPFVYHSWLKSYRDCTRPMAQCPDRVYYGYHHPLIERILARPAVQVLLAVDPQRPERIHGWICAEPAGKLVVVHYAYVKDLWRRKRIASLLAEAAGVYHASAVAYTWRSKSARHVARTIGAQFVPVEDFLA